MRRICIYTLFALGLIACHEEEENSTGNQNVKINSTDSVCLSLYTDIDSMQIKELGKKVKDNILIVFTGFNIHSQDLLSEQFISNKKISDELKQCIVVRLNVDNKDWVTESDSTTIGELNLSFQRDHYKISSQPYYLFVDKNLNRVGNPLGYTSDIAQIIDFLHQRSKR